MPDTFFTASPHWTTYIILYFFIGGIAGGAYFVAALLHWLGRPADERVVRLGYYVAAVGAILCAILLTIDLGKPLRFWHMLFQSERFPLLMLKPWSPMSAGSWGLLLFGLFATLSAVGALAADGRLRLDRLRFLHDGAIGRAIALVGGIFAFILAGYTGVLLNATNRPIWADTTTLGMLFLFSAASTAAATLILLARWRAGGGGRDPSVEWLAWFDGWVLAFELIALVVFLVSLDRNVAAAWLGWWGLLLLVLVVGLGILVPLALHFRPAWFREAWARRRIVAGAVLVLVGGFFLRVVVLLASASIGVPHGRY
ncbi:MAG: polysulfide reductase NrfD [Gemmatimonadetes bacterium]|nr:polysulfide reductase NrfD [Gemmatimonadota bacterium]